MNRLRVDTGLTDEHSESLFTGDKVANDNWRIGTIVFRYGRYQVKYDNYYTDLADEHDVLILLD